MTRRDVWHFPRAIGRMTPSSVCLWRHRGHGDSNKCLRQRQFEPSQETGVKKMIDCNVSSEFISLWFVSAYGAAAYDVFISQLIRYARACSSYEWAARLSYKLLEQGYVRERLKSSLRKFYGQYGDLIKHYEVPLSKMLHDILGHYHIQWHPLLIRQYTNLWTYYRTWPYYWFWLYYQISGGFHRTLQRVRVGNRGSLLLRKPGPVPFGTCICSNVETDFSWACHVFRFYISIIPRYFHFASSKTASCLWFYATKTTGTVTLQDVPLLNLKSSRPMAYATAKVIFSIWEYPDNYQK